MADPGASPAPAGAREPSLRIVRAPGDLRRRVLRALRLAVAMAVFTGGTSMLAAGGRLDVPFEHVLTLKGRLASVGDLFSDPQVVRLLRKHDLRVETVSAGSREVVTGDVNPWDFVFPSGAPAADLIHQSRQGKYSNEPQPQPFDSPSYWPPTAPTRRRWRTRGWPTASAPAGGCTTPCTWTGS